MKHLRTIVAVAVVTLAMVSPRVAAAQYHESRLDNFLDGHPHIKADLSSNPDLIQLRSPDCAADQAIRSKSVDEFD